jgi:adenylosuccinate lyase
MEYLAGIINNPYSLQHQEEFMSYDKYVSPLSERYAGKEMQYIFSPDMKFRTWRKLWVALAEAEKELGLAITEEQIEELKKYQDDINYDVAKEREALVRHDVMSHVYAYGVQCPNAKGIIHLGATSCYVGDNTDIIVMTEALKLVKKKLLNVMDELSKFAMKYKGLPTLAFTHFQPAQPTTVGKRAALWLMELKLDYDDICYVIDSMRLLGSKGTTGTQASFLELFDGDHDRIKRLDKLIAEKVGFTDCYPVSGQTYSRKIDTRVVNILAGIAASAHKFSNDIRLLQHLKEIEEPFEKNQIGSSAMAYKRNPMRSERIASLANYVMADVMNPAITSATQWFERTLDDSANKRISIPEAFLAVDGILDLYLNVVDGLVVYPKVIEKRLMAELPFMATENIMMDAVKLGGDRQELHEKIRTLSMEAGRNVKEYGLDNNLLELIAADPSFNMSLEELKNTMDPSKYTGRSEQQVEEFIGEVIRPILDENKALLGLKADIKV